MSRFSLRGPAMPTSGTAEGRSGRMTARPCKGRFDDSHSFDDAQAPSKRTTQYFEMFGHRGLWSQGWKAVAFHPRGEPFDNDEWELYDLRSDFNEVHDLAETEPDRLAEMIELAEPALDAYAAAKAGVMALTRCAALEAAGSQALGVAVGEQAKIVARLACAGGTNVALNRAKYQGIETCQAAALVSGGGKGCVWGCLGFGDCGEVCDFDAITMNRQSLPVVDAARCTACNDCVDICPRDLFSLQPVSHRLWVACSNPEAGDAAEADCRVLCNGCGRCVADAPEGLVTLRDKLAVVDYSRNALASPLAIERCPTGAIVWFDPTKGPVAGRAAKKVIRQSARRATAT